MPPTESKPSTERQRTEELLAGFDRTGRTPTTPTVGRDFVDYHRAPAARPASLPRAAEPTFVVRRAPRWPSWLAWMGVVFGMLAAGVAVGWAVRPATVTAPGTMPSFRLPAPAVSVTAAPAASTSSFEAAPVAPAPDESASSPRPRPAPRPSGFLRQL